MNELSSFIKVSVLVMTYNHAKFISKALDSVLMQETEFNYEILISEDCSSDRTTEIILSYHQKFPEKIRLLLSEKNLHSNEVVRRGIHAAKGEYIALLDGDDYWTSSEKLQKQAAYLDSHVACTLCFHNANAFSDNSEGQSWHWTLPNQKEISTLEDLWLGNFIATCSTMFRKNVVKQVPNWYNLFFPITDWPLYILIAEHGYIGYINEVMGAYRQHSGGLYSPYSEKEKQAKTLAFYKKIDHCLNYKYHEKITTAISIFFYDWAQEYKKRGEIRRAIDCYQVYLTGKIFNERISFWPAAKLGLKLYLRYGLRVLSIRNFARLVIHGVTSSFFLNSQI